MTHVITSVICLTKLPLIFTQLDKQDQGTQVFKSLLKAPCHQFLLMDFIAQCG
jgi:hypothetical protein